MWKSYDLNQLLGKYDELFTFHKKFQLFRVKDLPKNPEIYSHPLLSVLSENRTAEKTSSTYLTSVPSHGFTDIKVF